MIEGIESAAYGLSNSRVIEELKEVVSVNYLMLRQDMRSWREFVEKFGLPQVDVLKKRVMTNVIYFKANYFIIASLLLLVMSYWGSFHLLLVSKLITLCAFYLFHLKRSRNAEIFGKVLDTTSKTGILVGFSFLVSFIFGVTTQLFYYLGISSVFILVHSSLRPRSNKSKFSTLGHSADLGTNLNLEKKKEKDVASVVQSGNASLQKAVESEMRKANTVSYAEKRKQMFAKRRTNSNTTGHYSTESSMNSTHAEEERKEVQPETNGTSPAKPFTPAKTVTPAVPARPAKKID